MKKRVHWLVLLAVAVPFLGAARCNTADVKVVELTLFHTNDMHSHFRGAKSDPFGLGGLAKISTLLKRLRQAAPVSLTLDAGDYSEGTWYFAVDTGANMLRLMGKMGYDAVALGNHDFLMGPDQIISTMNEAKAPFPILASNLDTTAYSRAAEFNQVILPWTIKEVGGLKVGIIGLTTFQFVFDSYMRPIKITNIVDAATRIAKELRPNVDVLLLLSHNNFNDNVHLASAVPGVNAVISGHSHDKIPKAIMAQNAGRSVPIVETGSWGSYLGELKLQVAPDQKIVQFKNYELHPVSANIADDPEIAAGIDEQDRALASLHGDVPNRVIANAEIDLTRSDSQETAFGNLAVKAYRAATGADIALEEASLTGVSIAKGPATLMDVHDVVPHIFDRTTNKEWMLHIWNAKGKDLLLAMNVFYTIEGLLPMGSPLGWLLTDNAEIVWDPTITRIPLAQVARAGSVSVPAIKSVKIGGRALDPNARYKVVVSDGLWRAIALANELAHVGLDLSDLTDTGVQAWESVVRYASSAQKLSMADLGVGGHATVQSPDLGLVDYAISWDGAQLSVEVHNFGQKPSAVGKLNCSTGLKDNILAFETDLQVWTKLGTASIPIVQPGSSVTLQIPWGARRRVQAGYWPIECDVSSSGDKLVRNDSVQKVFRSL
jgi:5'-nucleotidase/UDP-sugar diphosphatase